MGDWWIDGETGLPIELAEKVKRRLVQYEERVIELMAENTALKQKFAELDAESRRRIAELEEKIERLEGLVTEKR